MSTIKGTITVITTDDRVAHHEYPFTTSEEAQHAVDQLFAEIMVGFGDGGKTLMLAHPQAIYMVDKVVSIKAQIS